MFLAKLKEKSLVTNQDIEFNFRYGIPIEVYCPQSGNTVSFGQIDSFDDETINIRNHSFFRHDYLFFGHPALCKTS